MNYKNGNKDKNTQEKYKLYYISVLLSLGVDIKLED